MKKKIILHLEGGLGNQLFQYAFGYSICKELNSNLYVDNKTGFFLDFRFGLKFALPFRNLKYASILDNILFILFRIFIKFFKVNNYILINNILFYHDKNTKKEIDLVKFKDKKIKKIYLIGFFQNPKLFNKYKSSIRNLILSNIPDNKKYLKYKKKINFQKSVCVGIRFWEETGKYYNDFGGVTPPGFYEKGADKIKINKPKFYIFSKANKKSLNLNLPSKINYVPNFKDKNETLNNLWLMSCFKYYIISNSTYYWWAAYLSKNSKKIIISNKFKNNKTIPKNWIAIR